MPIALEFRDFHRGASRMAEKSPSRPPVLLHIPFRSDEPVVLGKRSYRGGKNTDRLELVGVPALVLRGQIRRLQFDSNALTDIGSAIRYGPDFGNAACLADREIKLTIGAGS